MMKKRLFSICMVLVLCSALCVSASAMQIFVETPDDKMLTLEVEPGDSIDNVQRKILDQISLPAASQYLYFRGKLLSMGRTLADYNIQKKSVLWISENEVTEPTGNALTNNNISENMTLRDGIYYLDGCLQGSYSVNSIDISSPLTITGDVTLDLNGYVLKKTGAGSVIHVKSGATLTLTDNKPRAVHKFTVEENGLWVLNEDNGTQRAHGGVITGGCSSYGGGVYVEDGGTFTMESGMIAGCTATGDGGGVYVSKDSTMTMNGSASISGCTADSADSAGIYLAGTLTPNGGTVQNTIMVETRGKIAARSNGSTTGTIFTNAVLNYGTISDGMFAGMVTNGASDDNSKAGTIFGGTFEGEVNNNAGSMISGGTFKKTVTNTNGTISNGSFHGPVLNQSTGYGDGGKIIGGEFYEKVTNNGTITGGNFAGEISSSGNSVYVVSFIVDTTVYGKRCVTDGNIVISEPSAPTKENYTFAGWVYNNDALWNFTDTVSTNFSALGQNMVPGVNTIELTAKWTANVYHITYILDGGTNPDDNRDSYTYGVGLALLTPTRGGYTFDGWYKDASFTGDAITAISNTEEGDIKLYAKWTKITSSGGSSSSRSDGSRLADKNGSIGVDAKADLWRINGFTAGDKSLDTIDCTGLDIRLTTNTMWTDLTPAAMKQLLDSNAKSLTLVSGGAELKVPRAVLQQLSAQMNGENLRITLLTGEDALSRLPGDLRRKMNLTLKLADCRLMGAVTGEFTINNRPVDWSKNRVEMDLTAPISVPSAEEMMEWMQGMFDWRDAQNNSGSHNMNDWSWGIKPDENDKDIFRYEIYPAKSDKKPYESLLHTPFYIRMDEDWDAADLKSYLLGADQSFTFKPGETGTYFADFQVTHFSTYLLVARPVMPFKDVSEGAWYYDAVKWAADENITGGTDNAHFSPNRTCTRAQLVTMLWRMAGEPAANGGLPFADVNENAWYAAAVRWAASEGIVEGTTAATFAPDATLTRAQAAVMLYRYAKSSGKDVSVGEDTNILSYADALDLPEWAVGALQWACGAGVMQGSGGMLMPGDACSRAQTVTMLYRAQDALS